MLTFMGAITDPSIGLGQTVANGIGVGAATIVTVDGTTNIAHVYGNGSVVFAQTTTPPFVHPSAAVQPNPANALQLDISNVQLKWFGGGSSFTFESTIVTDALQVGNAAVVSIVNGDVEIVSGTLPEKLLERSHN